MSPDLVWKNIVAYCLQVGLLVGLAAFVPAVLRLRIPRAKLAYWQILLVACLVLPLVQTWQQEVITATVQVSTVVTAVASSGLPAPRRIPASHIALGLLAAGAMVRLGWLAVGFWRLWTYRRRSQSLAVSAPWKTRAEVRISRDISSPVTFGFRNPLVLVPAQFPEMDRRTQDAILCHELLHVERRDWLFTVGEELVRALFWFHPAIWWLLGEIQLAREQAVDREVIEMTQSREEYVDALLAIAGAKPQLDLAPAPLFLRKRHLKQRVVSILREGPISRARLLSALAAGLAVLAGGCWLVTNTFPLAAAPQIVSDAMGVSVDAGGAVLLHRLPVGYPQGARVKRIQGSVTLEVTLDASGSVSDARVLSGPEELRKSALESVLGWHFARESGVRRIVVSFQLPAEQISPARVTTATVTDQGRAYEARLRAERAVEEAKLKHGVAEVAAALDARRAELDAKLRAWAEARRAQERTVARNPVQILKTLTITGLTDELRGELLSKLPIREGNVITPGAVERAAQAAKEIDEHLTISARHLSETEMEVTIAAAVPQRIKVGGNVQQVKLVTQPRPMYPPKAKEARIQGVVKLSAVIDKDGAIRQLEVISGHPLLVPSALEAVKQWVYEPTYLNGNPVEVVTQIDVNYTLSQ